MVPIKMQLCVWKTNKDVKSSARQSPVQPSSPRWLPSSQASQNQGRTPLPEVKVNCQGKSPPQLPQGHHHKLKCTYRLEEQRHWISQSRLSIQQDKVRRKCVTKAFSLQSLHLDISFENFLPSSATAWSCSRIKVSGPFSTSPASFQGATATAPISRNSVAIVALGFEGSEPGSFRNWWIGRTLEWKIELKAGKTVSRISTPEFSEFQEPTLLAVTSAEIPADLRTL